MGLHKRTISNPTRWIALLACVFFLFVMATSFLFIAEQYDHNCTGEKCSICHKIIDCKKILQTVISILKTECVTAFYIVVAAIGCFPFVSICDPITLVTLKVKLSN